MRALPEMLVFAAFFLPSFAQGSGLLPSPLPSSEPPGPAGTQAFAKPHESFLKALKPLPEIKLKPEPRRIEAQELEPLLMLAGVEDAAAVLARAADGKERKVRAGDELTMGETLETGEKGSARIAFERGVQVLAPPGAVLRLSLESVAGAVGGLEVPVVELERGEARFLVESGGAGAAAAGGVPKPIKLLVRTRAVVMAVHGTDFIVSVSNDRTNLYMISGTVEVAREIGALGSASAVKPAVSESIETAVGRPLFKPEHYEMGVLLKDFHGRNPRLESLWSLAVREPKIRSLQPRFQALRTRKADAINMRNGFVPGAARRGEIPETAPLAR